MEDICEVIPVSSLNDDFADQLLASKINYHIKKFGDLLFITCHCSNEEEITLIHKIFELIQI